jgi:hypothetical protein
MRFPGPRRQEPSVLLDCFTAPNVSSTTPVTVTATSQAGTSKTASVMVQIGRTQSAGATLLGHSTVETLANGLYDGMAEGYQITASGNGTLSTLSGYVDSAATTSDEFVCWTI